MGKKKIKTDGIYFLGKSSDDVTGSQYLVKFGSTQCLLECGLYQSSSNSYLDSYRVNSEKFKFKPSEIDFVFIAHPHIDHCGLLPRLVKCGFHGKIIATSRTAAIMKPLLLNSAFIIKDEARILSKRYKRNYEPLYEEADVYNALNMVYEYDNYGDIVGLSDTVSFQWIRNSHCVGAAQLQLILSNGAKTKKILYTSDLGSLTTKNHFVSNTEIPATFNDVTLMESTYGSGKRDSRKTRSFDMELLKSAIDTTIERGGTVVLPCFSFSRTQELLSTLYELYSDDDSFLFDVIVDSLLSCDICDLYKTVLDEKDISFWESVLNWDRLKLIREKEESKSMIENHKPKVVLSASGFCTNGRVVGYLKEYIKDPNSIIVFSGYAGDNPSYLSYRIKQYRHNKTISINKVRIPNRADCVSLTTFSSHANCADLVRYGSSLNTNKLVLVHGDEESKHILSDKLKQAISNNNHTYKVLCAFRGMVVHL